MYGGRQNGKSFFTEAMLRKDMDAPTTPNVSFEGNPCKEIDLKGLYYHKTTKCSLQESNIMESVKQKGNFEDLVVYATFVNGQNLTDLSDTQLVNLIANYKNQATHLKELKTDSVAIKAQVHNLKMAVAAIVTALDTRAFEAN